MKGFGTLALVIGVCWLIFSLSMDVSVPTGAGGRVNNLGLMADRQIHTIVGGVIASPAFSWFCWVVKAPPLPPR